MNVMSFPKIGSSSFPTDWTLKWWEAVLLISGGVTTVVLHRAFDLSLGLPGHHGIEWMTLMILGRASPRFRGAGTLALALHSLPHSRFCTVRIRLPGSFICFRAQ
jgi:hypothetical protein